MTWLGRCRKGSPGGGALTWQSGCYFYQVGAKTIKVLAGHLPPQSAVLKKGGSPFVRGNLESLGQAARRPRVTSHRARPSLVCPTLFLLFADPTTS